MNPAATKLEMSNHGYSSRSTSAAGIRALRARTGFTLVEIMIVVVIIGLLAAMAIPAFGRVRQKAQNARFMSDLRTFSQAFESYAMVNGTWPANAGSGAVPSGMSGDFNASSWRGRNSVGGRWNWDRNLFGFSAAVSTTNVTVSDSQMILVDATIDDGDLSSGLFQKSNDRFVFVLEP